MPEAYDLHDGRFIQEWLNTTAADALTDGSGVLVPEGKVHTILSASYFPSVAETRTVFFVIMSRSGVPFPVTLPVAIALSPTILLPLLTQGMEIKLFPGEYLAVWRDVATLGSAMTLKIRFIETDLPFYSYVEPLNRVVKQAKRHGSVYRSTGGVSVGRDGAGGGGEPPPGGGRGEPQPI